MQASEEFEWDAFFCHASEDKALFVEPLVEELQKYGLKIWFDKFTLQIGSSLRESIDLGLAKSRFGIVALSHAFFAKTWPQKELNALFSRQVNGRDVILPIWHELTKEDILRYSPLLSDMVAAKSSDGLVVVARSLVQVIRPTSLQIETTLADAQNVAGRMREQLKDKHPNLDFRVTLGQQELDPLRMIAKPSEPGVIASSAQEGMRIDVFAPDKEAYEQNPLSCSVTMTQEAWKSVQEAQRRGKLVELGPGEIIDFSSDFFQSFMPPSEIISSGIQRLIVSPSQDVMQKRFRFKLTFALAEAREEFPYVEFEIVQPGQEEIIIRSSAPPMPLQLTLTFDFGHATNKFSAKYSCVGHEIRKIHKAHTALQLLLVGGTLEIMNLESDQVVCRLGGAREISPPSEADLYLDKFIEALYEVAVAFNEKITWSANRTRDDSIHIQALQEIVRTGQLSIPASEINITMVPMPGKSIEDELRLHSPLLITQSEPPDFATVFGKTFDVGPYVIVIRPQEFETSVPAGAPDTLLVRIVLAEPLIYQFEKFQRERPIPVDKSAA
jgi:TIR domain